MHCQDWLVLVWERRVLWAWVVCAPCCLPACVPPRSLWKWFDWLPRATSFPLPSSCLHLPCPVLWGLLVLSASDLQLLPASLRRSPVQLPPLLSASSGPPHLLSCWVGSYRRSALSLKPKHAGLLACHFSSLHSWSFTFVSEVTFSTRFSRSFSASAPRLKILFFTSSS